jgi:LuxR family transcriptional regulator, maltose regulon positive regulatory protein
MTNAEMNTMRRAAGLSPIWGEGNERIGGLPAIAGSYSALLATIAIRIVGKTSLFLVRNPWDNSQSSKDFVAIAATLQWGAMSQDIGIERKLAAVLAADVAGFSRLTEADEVGTMRMLAAQRAILDAAIARHRGRIANTAGDSVLAEFPSAVNAVQCAVEAQQALRDAAEGAPADRRVLFRIGIHVGDVMVRGGDLLGNGVNVAARLEGLADAGGIVLSAAAHEQVRKVLPLAYIDLGPQSVKNIEEPVRAVVIGGSSAAPQAMSVPATQGDHAASGGLPQIALTKTVPPVANRIRVERARLLDLLQQSAARRLILLKAPAGYGKTTLAVDWVEQLRRSAAIVAWLSVDEDDDEPSAFAYHVTKTIHRAAPELGQSAIDLLAETKLIAARNVVSAAINAVAESDDEVYLFLDDYHAITDPRSHELTAFLLRYAPSNFHLVIISRIEPPLSISRLRLADEVAELDVTSLQFTLEETGQFLSAESSPRLGAAEISKLHDATEGWPAALQLARISVRNSPDPAKTVQSFSGASRKISAYIEDTLATQADEIVQFLLQTAILDRLHGSLCQAVTGIMRSAELLEALNHEQLLVMTIDEVNGWYRYHHLMSDFLLARLQTRMADQIPELHRRASRWYASQELWNHAVQHAIAAKDFDQALGYVEQCAMSLVIKGDLLTLLAWERQLPAELMSGQIQVKLALSWGMALVTRFAEARALLAQVEEKAQHDRTSDLWWRCQVLRAAILGLTDDSAQARDVAAECLQYGSHDAFNMNSIWNITRYGHLKAGDPDAFYAVPKPDPQGDEATYVLAENYRLCLYGMAAAHKLEVDGALGFYSDARALAEKYVGAKSVSAAMTTGLRALMRYERGDVSAAEISVLDELAIIETTAYHESFLSAYTVLVRAAWVRGDTERALMLLDRAERLASERGWSRLVAMFLLERIRFTLRDERFQDARAAADRLQKIQDKHPALVRSTWSEIHIASTIAEGLLTLASDRADAAVQPLTWGYDELLATDNRHGALRAGLELSNALFLAGSHIKAFDVLKQVLGWATNAKAVSFALERPRDFRQLMSAAQKEPSIAADHGLHTFLENLMERLRAHDRFDNGSTGVRAPKQTLTDRERAIIEFIAGGQSNKQIARTLGVTPETIKSHMKRIFMKLSAESRAQAVVRAQSLGFLRIVQTH